MAPAQVKGPGGEGRSAFFNHGGLRREGATGPFGGRPIFLPFG
ncbi:hypothetical protein NSU_0183 [Novosphingobium pentaromativorans US6-1]|uniref:Uncharacterized protein n=1 Tax=Novosphingobium pentaromativorans US6-1 TaxID=1088721 RepID=G6E762_9SPHN|nr:hypothetical protein NSU_0183 [Novosphingobium pentaromativorans US6-1]